MYISIGYLLHGKGQLNHGVSFLHAIKFQDVVLYLFNVCTDFLYPCRLATGTDVQVDLRHPSDISRPGACSIDIFELRDKEKNKSNKLAGDSRPVVHENLGSITFK